MFYIQTHVVGKTVSAPSKNTSPAQSMIAACVEKVYLRLANV